MTPKEFFYSTINVTEGQSAMNYRDLLATHEAALANFGITLQRTSPPSSIIRGRLFLNNASGPFDHAVDPFTGSESDGTLAWGWQDRGGPEFIPLQNPTPLPSPIADNAEILAAIKDLKAEIVAVHDRLDVIVENAKVSLTPILQHIMGLHN